MGRIKQKAQHIDHGLKLLPIPPLNLPSKPRMAPPSPTRHFREKYLPLGLEHQVAFNLNAIQAPSNALFYQFKTPILQQLPVVLDPDTSTCENTQATLSHSSAAALKKPREKVYR